MNRETKETALAIVAASGKLTVEVSKEMTGKDVIDHALSKWGIPATVLEDPFVVWVDHVTGKTVVCGSDESVASVMGSSTGIFRVVLPLRIDA